MGNIRLLKTTAFIITLMGLAFNYIYSYNLLLFVKASGFVWYAWEVSVVVTIISSTIAVSIGYTIQKDAIDQAVRKALQK